MGKLNGACVLLLKVHLLNSAVDETASGVPFLSFYPVYGIYVQSSFAQSFDPLFSEGVCLSPGLDVSIPCRLQCQRSLDPLDTRILHQM